MTKYKKIKTREAQNTKPVKERKELSDEEKLVRRFLILAIIMLIVIVGLYFLTKITVKNENNDVSSDEVAISYDNVTVGTMLNRPYDDYYVIVYDSTSPRAIYFSQIINSYSSKNDAKKVYFCDLDEDANKKYVSLDGNTKVDDDFNTISFGEPTLIHIKKNKIEKVYKGEKEIVNILK